MQSIKLFSLNPKLFFFFLFLFHSGEQLKHGADFSTLYTMANENYKELYEFKSHDNKDVEFSIVETE